MRLKWFVKHEPVIVGGILSGIGVFFGVRYGAHSTAALQGALGLGSASFVSLLSRWVGPSAVGDIEGIANDIATLKQQIGPLPKTGGLGGVAKWLADLATQHGNNLRADLQADIDAAKADIRDLIHKAPVAVAEPPSTATTQATVAEPVQTVPEPASEAPTPVPEPSAEETQLKALIGQ